MKLSESEWREKLTPEQYSILRQAQTEAPFSGAFLYNEAKGIYVCAACGHKLFKSEQKFDALCGWPSFYDVIDKKAVSLKEDLSHGLRRVEVTCANCGSHLGHVFNDAPEQPTGMRFCINSLSLDFNQAKVAKDINRKAKK
jgi:peptide-methionine (R)-S-oxide reductase